LGEVEGNKREKVEYKIATRYKTRSRRWLGAPSRNKKFLLLLEGKG